jgi:hypothetical protein
MHNLLKFVLLSIVATLISTSCVKESSSNINQRAIATVVNNYQTYSYDLGIAANHENATIITQASNFERSEIVRDASTDMRYVYFYKPLNNFTGNDMVEIEICSGGTSQCSSKEKLTINFTVIN